MDFQALGEHLIARTGMQPMVVAMNDDPSQPKSMRPFRILVVDDEANIRKVMTAALAAEGFCAFTHVKGTLFATSNTRQNSLFWPLR